MAVTKVERITRETSSPSVRRFKESQSLPARSRRGQFKAANDNGAAVESFEAANDNFETFPETYSSSGSTEKRDEPASLLVRNAFLGVELAIAGTCSFFQGMCALWAVAFIAVGQMTLPIVGVTGDKAAEFIASPVGGVVMPVVRFFDNIFGNPLHTNVLPQELPANITGVGLALWGIGFLFTLLGFLTLLFLFHLQKIRVFDNTMLLIATVCLISLSIVPGLQLFPWMVSWVFAIHTSTTASKMFS